MGIKKGIIGYKDKIIITQHINRKNTITIIPGKPIYKDSDKVKK